MLTKVLKYAPGRNFALFKDDITNLGYRLRNMTIYSTFKFFWSRYEYFKNSFFLYANLILKYHILIKFIAIYGYLSICR